MTVTRPSDNTRLDTIHAIQEGRTSSEVVSILQNVTLDRRFTLEQSKSILLACFAKKDDEIISQACGTAALSHALLLSGDEAFDSIHLNEWSSETSCKVRSYCNLGSLAEYA